MIQKVLVRSGPNDGSSPNVETGALTVASKGVILAATIPSEWGLIPIREIGMSLALGDEVPPPHPLPTASSFEAERWYQSSCWVRFENLRDERAVQFEHLALHDLFVPCDSDQLPEDGLHGSLPGLKRELEVLSRAIDEVSLHSDVGRGAYLQERKSLILLRVAVDVAIEFRATLEVKTLYKRRLALAPIQFNARSLEGFDDIRSCAVIEDGRAVIVELMSRWRYRIPVDFMLCLYELSLADAVVVRCRRHSNAGMDVWIQGSSGGGLYYFPVQWIHSMCEPLSTDFGSTTEPIKRLVERFMQDSGPFRMWPDGEARKAT